MELFPSRILEELELNKLDKKTAISNLLSLISNSSNINKRLESIKILKTIGIKGKEFFPFFENLMISDSNDRIRKIAIRIIRKFFIDNAFEPMCWAYKHEESIKCILEIISTLSKINGSLTKEYLIKQLSEMEISKFREFITNLNERNNLTSLSINELSEILQNYHIVKYLLEKFKRIQYKLQNGRIYDLNLSFMIYNIYDPKVMGILPSFFKYLTNLHQLDLQLNKFTIIPKSIIKLPVLKTLNLSNNHFRYLPEYFSQLTSLINLNLSYNDIRYLPKNFGELKDLESLDLKHNQLLKIPLTFKKLTCLKHLNLHGNKLEHIPNELFYLKGLIHLELGLNEIEDIPTEITQLSSLQKLCLGGNCISPASFLTLMNMKRLSDLELYDNKLTMIPDNIRTKNRLKNLSLHNNRLEGLPTTFTRLNHLESLDLSWNNYTKFPEEISELTSLKFLNLSGNKITHIPSWIINLKNLRSLNLIYNKIHDQTDFLAKMEQHGISIQI
ncbi:MAG: hypothetical protein EU547_01710 [Promethearchaeota archaeon]|nr:MAG: hypothetical protein EU547_01710 [Candidatus Lokiarchaeota archaeon]